MSRAPRKRRQRIPKEGPHVFVAQPEDPRPLVAVPVGGKLLKCRMEKGRHVKMLTPEEYCGLPRSGEPLPEATT